jgi:opacity protein-like surface antigen
MPRVNIPIVLVLVSVLVGVSGVPARAEDSDRFRPYIGLRFFDTNPATGVHDLFGFSLGANINRYFGAELAGDRYEVHPDISPYGTIGEYGVFALIPQVRVRYPLLDDKLVPYFIGGVGAAFTQFNDRKPRGAGLSIQDQSDTVVAGTAGLGIEYFVADNIAVGVEARYLLAPDPTLLVQGNREKIKISAPLFSFGIRMFYPELHPAPMAEAREHVPTRFYIGARAGGAVIVSPELIPGLEAEPTNNAIGGALSKYFGVSGGFNFGRYLGLEIALDGYEVNLDLNGSGNIGEYAVYTAIPYLRVRYPMAGDRLQPYFLGGFGFGHTEFNDRKPPGNNLSIVANSNSWAMGFGAGIEYFMTSNIALGMEMKYVYTPGHPITIGSNPTRDAAPSALLFSIGLRAFLFDFPRWTPSTPTTPPTAPHTTTTAAR